MIWPNAWSPDFWFWPALVMAAIALGAVVWSVLTSKVGFPIRLLSFLLKLLSVVLLVTCLLEPLQRTETPRKDANLFAALVDQSESLNIRDQVTGTETRAELLNRAVVNNRNWQTTLDEAFDFRRYLFDSRLRSVNEFASLAPTSTQSSLYTAMESLQQRLRGKPCGGILLFTDGNYTDENRGNLERLVATAKIPVYPVRIGGTVQRDLAIRNVTISQTNFETSPVSITAELAGIGFGKESISVELVDEVGKAIKTETIANVVDNQKFAIKFEVRPVGGGTHFYSVRVRSGSTGEVIASAVGSNEATGANNVRTVAVDRGQGPFRILYVGGRPNWEMKFFGRALADDDEVELISMVRVAKREPKFSFRGRRGENANPLFRGFDNLDEEDAEKYDEPVLITMPFGNPIADKLRKGFPRERDALFEFDAIVLDDVEADFFSPDQRTLLEEFVAIRGGTLLMLGGVGTFQNGNYLRTPIGEMLPVYLDRGNHSAASGELRLDLTREGWLQPWVRLRATEPQENNRLQSMPSFQIVTATNSIKPGASVLASVKTADDEVLPALVVQRFGKGHSAAMLIGDFWRWQMQKPEEGDLMKAWRQLARWMVSDVPRRFDVKLDHEDLNVMRARIELRDPEFLPLDNCRVTAKITAAVPAATEQPAEIVLTATPHNSEAGIYELEFTPKSAGPIRFEWTAKGANGEELGTLKSGWVCQPAAKEYQQLNANQDCWERIAAASGGKIIELDELNDFCNSIPVNSSMATEVQVTPWWHNWLLFVSAIGCLVTEWGLRRWKGLP
jgi:uncharacterized membrane protein